MLLAHASSSLLTTLGFINRVTWLSAVWYIDRTNCTSAPEFLKMGTFIGHVLPGAGFLAIGLWHLFNTITNYARSPWEFRTRPWFPANFRGKSLKRLELISIIVGASLSISAELFIGPEKHQPLADDWSIPPEHLNNFEHSSISLFFLIYAALALYVDKREVKIPEGMMHVIAALAFSQELLLFHLHSADHMGVEGQYHWLLQLIVGLTLFSTLLEIPFQSSFLVAMARSMSIVFQGVWFIHMGFMLWIPAFIPKGCEMQRVEGHDVVKCGEERATMRAKALANLQFNWYLASLLLFTMFMYARIMRHHRPYEALDSKPAKGTNKEVEVKRGYTRNGSQRCMDLVIEENSLLLER